MSLTLFGQDLEVVYNQLKSLVLNIGAWSFSFIQAPKQLLEVGKHCAIVVRSPGGFEALESEALLGKKDAGASTSTNGDETVYATVGYNVKYFQPPYVRKSQIKEDFPADLVVVNIKNYSVNYADVCIRWGLYESALRFVGYPICPGFDFSGVVEVPDKEGRFALGDLVFGFTLFGSYSTRLIVPSSQIRRIPVRKEGIVSMPEAAAIPAVAATALHAVKLAGGWPNKPVSMCKAALVHSAAGGVGTMLLRILKLQGYHPIVAVVGSSHKVEACKRAGADHVIDKQAIKGRKGGGAGSWFFLAGWQRLSDSDALWAAARQYAPDGLVAVFDANGVETLQQSYTALAQCGTLVTYGFHTNLPKHTGYLNPLNWVHMVLGVTSMPKFDPMEMVLGSKAIAGFNLSFFADEKELIKQYMGQLVKWIESGDLQLSGEGLTILPMKDIRRAHELIQTGRTVGKLVIET